MKNENDHSQKPWIIALLIFGIIGILAIFSLYLYQILQPTPEPLSLPVPIEESAIENELTPSQTAPQVPSTPSADPSAPTASITPTPSIPALQRFKAVYGFAAFSYLPNWHIAFLPNEKILYLSPQPIGINAGPATLPPPITMRKMDEGEAFMAHFENEVLFSAYNSSSITVNGKSGIKIEVTMSNASTTPGQKKTHIFVGGYELTFAPSAIPTNEEDAFNTLIATIQLN